MPKQVKSLPYSDIFNNVLSGFDFQLSNIFGNNYDRTMKVVSITNDEALSSLVAKTNQDKVGFPFFARKYNSIEENPVYNNWLFRQSGKTLVDDTGLFFQFRLLPVKINLTVSFICNDDKDLRLYAQRWMDCAKMHYIDFFLVIHDNNIKIRVDCDANFSFPDFQSGSDISDIYNAESTVTIWGFMGSITPIKAINKFTQNVYQVYSFQDTTGTILIQNDALEVRSDGLYRDGVLVSPKE